MKLTIGPAFFPHYITYKKGFWHCFSQCLQSLLQSSGMNLHLNILNEFVNIYRGLALARKLSIGGFKVCKQFYSGNLLEY